MTVEKYFAVKKITMLLLMDMRSASPEWRENALYIKSVWDKDFESFPEDQRNKTNKILETLVEMRMEY